MSGQEKCCGSDNPGILRAGLSFMDTTGTYSESHQRFLANFEPGTF